MPMAAVMPDQVTIFNLANFDCDIVTPSCILGSWRYSYTFYLTISLPLIPAIFTILYARSRVAHVSTRSTPCQYSECPV